MLIGPRHHSNLKVLGQLPPTEITVFSYIWKKKDFHYCFSHKIIKYQMLHCTYCTASSLRNLKSFSLISYFIRMEKSSTDVFKSPLYKLPPKHRIGLRFPAALCLTRLCLLDSHLPCLYVEYFSVGRWLICWVGNLGIFGPGFPWGFYLSLHPIHAPPSW